MEQCSWALVARGELFRRYGQAGAVEGDSVFFFGGCSEEGAFSPDLVLLDLPSYSARRLPDLTRPGARPFARHFHSCALVHGCLYLFGGKSNGYHNDLFRFDLHANVWKLVKAEVSSGRLFARFGQSAVLWQNCMYIFGGYDQHGFCCDGLHAFDFDRESWFQELKTSGKIRERYHHSAVVHGRCMYVFGGRCDNDSLGDLVEYHFDSRSWQTVITTGTGPSKRWGHSAAVVGDCMYVFGGCDGQSCFGDLYEYNFQSRKWSQVSTPHSPAPRYFQMMVVHGLGKLCIIGGKDMRGRCFDEVHEIQLMHRGLTLGSGSGTLTFDPRLSPPGSLTASQLGGMLTPEAKVRMKLHFDEEIRVLVVAKNLAFEKLLVKLREQYTETVSFRYKDEEGDMITVRSEDDWQEALEFYDRSKSNVFKVFLESRASRPSSLQGNTNFVSGGGSAEVRPSPRQDDKTTTGSTSSGHRHMPISWKLGERIGAGAFGQVYKVLNAETGELFAMKQVRITQASGNKRVRSVVDSLMHEIEMMQELNHPNIVRYLGSEQRDDTLCIFMEFVSGGSIASMLQKFSSFPEKVVCSFTKQILDGLSYLHEKKLIHRDLKGANILLTPDGIVKLADFGAAKKLLDIRTATDNNNADGTMTGTPYWMAPEVIRGNVNYGRKADIWSMGICVIEMATGRPPYSDLGPVTALFKIGSTEQAPDFPASLGETAHSFLALCLTRDPKARASAEDLLQHEWIVNYQRDRLKQQQQQQQQQLQQHQPHQPSQSDSQLQVATSGMNIASLIDATIVEYLELSRSTDSTFEGGSIDSK